MTKMLFALLFAMFALNIWAADSADSRESAADLAQDSSDSAADSRESTQDSSQNPALIQNIKSELESRFLRHYADFNIKINDLSINPLIERDLAHYRVEKILFTERDLRKDSGNFEVHLRHNERVRKAFFAFKIDATIDALTAASSIKTSEVITSANTQLTPLSLSKNLTLPARANILDNFMARSFIAAGSVITPNKIAPKTLIKKGEIISVNFLQNGISINFNAKALEDGALGDIIRAQNTQSGKEINIEILGAKSAKIAD